MAELPKTPCRQDKIIQFFQFGTDMRVHGNKTSAVSCMPAAQCPIKCNTSFDDPTSFTILIPIGNVSPNLLKHTLLLLY